MYYNPYFPGGAIGMAQALLEDAIEYEDGTEASISQMAKVRSMRSNDHAFFLIIPMSGYFNIPNMDG